MVEIQLTLQSQSIALGAKLTVRCEPFGSCMNPSHEGAGLSTALALAHVEPTSVSLFIKLRCIFHLITRFMRDSSIIYIYVRLYILTEVKQENSIVSTTPRLKYVYT